MSIAVAILAALLTSVVSWVALFVAVGNVGLQRAVALGPHTLMESPLALLLPLTAAFTSGYIWSWRTRPDVGGGTAFLGAILACDLVAAFVLAPAAVGELRVEDAALVLATITIFGAQIFLAAMGVLLPRVMSLAARP